MIQQAIKSVVEGRDLSREEAYQVMNFIMRGEATPAQIAAFAIAEKLKGETYQEVAGFAWAMREQATAVKTKRGNAIDMCGTGGDGVGTFNISTVASFVVAGAGVAVAKHGNRSVSSQCGSADLLEALGVRIELPPETLGECLDDLNIAFLFAPLLHKAMKHAVAPRQEIGVRTFFNMLGPLTNPARVTRQVLGVFHPSIARLMAEVLRELKSDHVMIIHSEDGLDEVSVQHKTRVVELKDSEIFEKFITPEDFGLDRAEADSVLGGTPEQNAKIARSVLEGERGIARDIVLANAACGIYVGGKAETLAEGTDLARASIDSGAARDKLEALKRMTNGT